MAIGLYIYFCLCSGYAKFRGMICESQKTEPVQSVVDLVKALELGDRDVVVSCDTLWRFLKRQGISFKKNRVRDRAGSS